MKTIMIGGQVTAVPALGHITQIPAGKFNNKAHLKRYISPPFKINVAPWLNGSRRLDPPEKYSI